MRKNTKIKTPATTKKLTTKTLIKFQKLAEQKILKDYTILLYEQAGLRMSEAKREALITLECGGLQKQVARELARLIR